MATIIAVNFYSIGPSKEQLMNHELSMANGTARLAWF
jgi:hypothetical protein